MWVCTSFGILMPGLRPPHTVEPGDTKVLQVRARRKKDLEILRDKYMGDTLGEIFSLPHTDYEWRAYSTLEDWGKALAQIAMDIDYVKFKETAETKFHDKDLHDAYMSMWGTIFSKLGSWKRFKSDSGWSLSGQVGKYGSTYGGTGNFYTGGTTSKKKNKKKGKHRQAGTSRWQDSIPTAYDPAQDPYAYLGQRPWWADDDPDYDRRNQTPTGTGWAECENPYRNDDDDLGLGGYDQYIARLETIDSGRGSDSFSALLDQFDDLDPNEKPVFKSENEIDHTFCDHGISKSAKKRCRARWRRYAKARVTRMVEVVG